MRKVLLVVAMLGAACGGEKTPVEAAVGDAVVDSTQADVGADAGPVSVDASSDGDAATDGLTDAPPSKSVIACATLADGYCAGLEKCCGKSAATTAQCQAHHDHCPAESVPNKNNYEVMKEVIDAGDLTIDPATDASCTAALIEIGVSCTTAAAIRARDWCQFKWFDTAGLGDACHAPARVACAQGAGRCVAVQPPDGYKCFAAGAKGSSCSATQPCQVGLDCLEGALTRAKVCGEPGSTCNLSDKCRQGFKCEGGTCKADASVAPAPPWCKP